LSWVELGWRGQVIGLEQAVMTNIPCYSALFPRPSNRYRYLALLHQQASAGTPNPTAMTQELKRMSVTSSVKIHFAMVQMGQETSPN
ncbi:MAG: hypothetical protein ABL936_10490, partial [Aestuariivirga sp.]